MDENNEKTEVKHISDIVGNLGKWQFSYFFFSTILVGVSAFSNMGYAFHAFSNDYWCSDVPTDLALENRTTMMKCFQYSNPNQSCTEWQYDRSQFRNSITTEFNLVCGRANYASFTQSAYMLGYVIPGLVFAHYSDKYGRRPITWLCLFIEILGISLSVLSFNIYVYGASRFFSGMGSSGRTLSIYTTLIEVFGPKYRSDMMLLRGTGWVVGFALTSGLAYLAQDFRYMQLVSGALLIPMCIWFYFLDESPRWQITSGLTQKAEQTLRKALQRNGKQETNLKEQIASMSEYLRKVQAKDELTKTHSIWDLLKTPNLRKMTLISWYCCVVFTLLYYGFSFNMADFGGDFYVSTALAGVIELPSMLLSVFALRMFPRRYLLTTFMSLAALSCITVIFSHKQWLKTMFALTGKLGVTCAWDVMGLMEPEMYPTILRQTGMGASSVVGRIGSISAPFMKNLAANFGLSAVMILYATLTIIGALLGLLLPETKGREIPDTIEEAENRTTIELKFIESKKGNQR